MAKTREQKQKILQDLKDKITRQKAMVFVDFSGIKVKSLTEMRKKMKEKDCQFEVAKKTLIEIALKDFLPELSKKVRELKGEIGLGFGFTDEILPFKILGDFSKEQENLKILGGVMNQEFLEAEQAIALGNLPSKQELLARLVGSISAPISNFVNVLQGNIKGLLCILKQIKV